MNKTLIFPSLAAASLFAVSSAFGGAIATPHVAGSLQGWDPASSPMTETFLGSDIWTVTFAGLTATNREEFKITDGTWTTTVPSGPNSWAYTDGAGALTITYDGNTYADGWFTTVDRIGVSTDLGTWTAVGDWQSQVGGADWDNANASTVMTHVGGNIYELTATLAPGSYNWKSVSTGSWDSISSDARNVNTGNMGFTTDAVNNTATFRVDALNGVVQVIVVPEPSTFALILGGLAMVLTVVRRRGK